MKTPPLFFQQATALGIALLGLYVAVGWLFGSETMVRIVPNSVAMALNTALLFVAAAICLWPGQAISRVRVFCAWLLVFLPCVILFEHGYDINLGIDWTALHATVKDGNPQPGRTSPNACLGFLLAGITFLLLESVRIQTNKTLQTVIIFGVYAVMLIGLTALVGYFLQLEILYRFAVYNRMAAPTALGMSFIGLGLYVRMNTSSWRSHIKSVSPDTRITRTAAVVLSFVALITGLTGFAVLKLGFEKSISDSWMGSTKNAAAVFSAIIDQRLLLATTIASRPALQRYLLKLNDSPNDQEALTRVREIGESFLSSGLSSIRFFNLRDEPLTTIGTMASQNAVMSVPIQHSSSRARLLWDNGLVLWTEKAVMHEGRIVGKFIAEQRLTTLTAMLRDLEQDNRSTDVLVCARSADDAVCFPSRFYKANLHIPLYKDGKPYLAISRALLGQRGVMSVKDLRGIAVLAGYAPVGELGLGLVLKTDSIELYTPIRQRLNLLAALLVALVAIGTLVLRAQVKPLARRLVEEHAALQESEERLRVTLHSIGDAVITADTAGKITYLNPIAEQMTGWGKEEAIGLPLPDVFKIVHDVTGEIAANPVAFVLKHEKSVDFAASTTLIQRNGARFAIEDSAAPIRDPDGAILGVVLVFRDVSHARKMAAEMTHQASHDALTGLINRREFERRLTLVLQTGEQEHKEHTLLYLDLDQFKIVNDTCGHLAGDELLRQLSALLLGKLRHSDTLSRLGGDEFGILLESCASEPAKRIAEVLRQTVSDFRFGWLDKVFPIGVSIGQVSFSNDGVVLSDVLRMADAACYVAKDKGRNRIHVYTPEDKELILRSGEMGWIGRIQKALDEQRFVLYSQQILGLGDKPEPGEHYELLLRMRDEQGELIPPMAFIPAAERYGLMPQLDRWVITEAFSQYAVRHPPGTPCGMCAINLSGKSVGDESFLAFIQEAFARYNVPPKSICFEVTETAVIGNLSQASTLIRELKSIGCHFALDDFGSGMASFAYLKHLPVDFLKIDGGFVKDMMHEPIDRAMVKSIHDIGHVMGIQTIAECVESEAILGALREIGVNFAQGYAVEKPRPAW